MHLIQRHALATVTLSCFAILIGCGTDNSVIQEGLEAFREQVQTEISDNPVIVENIGTIQSFEIDMAESEELPGENDFAFSIQGSKGKGVMRATCITIDEFTEDVTAGTLEMSTGETFNLFP